MTPSPPYLFWAGLAANYSAPAFWSSFWTILLLGCAALVFPSLYAPRAWRESGERASAEAPSRSGRSFRYGSANRRARCRRQLDENPFYWLAGRDLMPAWTVWCLLGPLFCIWAHVVFVDLSAPAGPTPNPWLVVGGLASYVMHQVLKYLVALEASRRWCDERRSGTLEPLLVTPISAEEILAGQRRALGALFLWPMLLVLATNLGLLCDLVRWDLLRGRWADADFFIVAGLGGAGLMFLDCHALSLVGMWLAVKARGHRQAVFGTLARVMLGPWLAVACLVLMRGLGGSVATESIICWFGVCALLDLALANWARAGLLSGLRDTSPPSPVTDGQPADTRP
jgi:hypothetical protein